MEQNLKDKKKWIISVHIFAAALAGFWIPLRIVFFDEVFFFDYLIDVFFMGLIGCEYFKIGSLWQTKKEEELLESSIEKLINITIHLLMWLPFGSVLSYLEYPYAKYFFLLKLIQLRHFKSIRILLESYDNLHPVVARLLPIGFIMPTLIHALSCGWVWLGSGTAGPHEDKFFEYGRAVYWAFTTLSTVGYGDISGKTLPQMFYCNFTMVIGVAFFGYVLSNVASILARLDAARESHLALLDKVESFMRYNEVPVGLRSKIRAYYRYLWESHRGYDDSQILNNLPHKLRGEVSLFLNAEMIEKVPLLKGAEQDLVQDIVLQLKLLVVVPGERIFQVGDVGESMFFIHRGSVDIISREGKIVATLQPGSFFGEMALLTTNPRNATVRAADYCDLFVLERKVFESVLSRYPTFEKHVKQIAAQREAEIKVA